MQLHCPSGRLLGRKVAGRGYDKNQIGNDAKTDNQILKDWVNKDLVDNEDPVGEEGQVPKKGDVLGPKKEVQGGGCAH